MWSLKGYQVAWLELVATLLGLTIIAFALPV